MKPSTRRASTTAAVLLSLLAAGCGTAPTEPRTPAPSSVAAPSSSRSASPPRVVDQLGDRVLIAHRGGAAERPESSLAAFRAAAQSGFPVETDLRTLKDGTLVPLHDDTVDRTTDGVGSPHTMAVSQWKRLHVDVGPGGPVPTSTWDEVLDAVGGRIVLVVETKDRAAVRPFIESVLDRGLQKSVIAQSFERADVLATAKAGIPSMLLTSTDRDFSRMRASGIDYLGCSGKTADLAGYVHAARAAGMKVAVWTVDDPARARAAFAAGAFAVMTNAPWRLEKVASAP